MPRKSKIPLDTLVDGMDFPHKRHEGWKWSQEGAAPRSKPGFSYDRLVFYAGQLRDLGMSDGDISCLLTDMYWDSFTECLANRTFEKEWL
jgi:hypothetical protein